MLRNAPPFEELLAGCRKQALHLELRDSYADPYEAQRIADWKAGVRHTVDSPRELWWHPWLDLVQETVARGIAVRRARVVSEPVSDYTHALYDRTFANVHAGEDVRWLSRRKTSDIGMPGNDFWLFDDTIVRFGYFAGDGTYLGDEVDDDPAVLRLCARAFDEVWDRATPHAEYRI
ncbi:hypothetical protein GCM10023205_79420 [Yinghuangia aomiensis]|uniref:DUF6879 domain-containing protein n=1 Tax=Yinghuangia aomiensis TaxID=676205 RepID=A0ABP9ICH8_9ACTN